MSMLSTVTMVALYAANFEPEAGGGIPSDLADTPEVQPTSELDEFSLEGELAGDQASNPGEEVVLETPAAAKDWFGALYYSYSTGAHGWANNYDTREIAEALAFQACSKYATDCGLMFWVQNQCGSFAQGTNTGNGWPIGFAWDVQRPVAALNALINCNANGSGCNIVVTFCAGQ